MTASLALAELTPEYLATATSVDHARDLVDDVAARILAAHAEGRLTERQVREELATVLCLFDVAEQVAGESRSKLSPQGVEDLAEELRETLMTKVLDTAANGYSIDKGAGASFCGWARQIARAAVGSKKRGAYRADRRHGTAYDPTVLAETYESASEAVFEMSMDPDDISSRLSATLSEIQGEMRTRRGPGRVTLAAEALINEFDLNPAVRPAQTADRDLIADALMRDGQLAWESLLAWANRMFGSDPNSVSPNLDSRLLAIWDGQTRESARALLDLPAQVAYTVALAAVQRQVRPGERQMSKTRTVLNQAATGKNRTLAWKQAVAALAHAYFDTECEAVSRNNAKAAVLTESEIAAQVAGQQMAVHHLAELERVVIEWPTAPLGHTSEEVRAAFMAAAVNRDALPSGVFLLAHQIGEAAPIAQAA